MLDAADNNGSTAAEGSGESAIKALNGEESGSYICLWDRDDRDFDRDTLNILRSLPTEKDFIYVNARSLLPRDIIYNKVKWLLSNGVLLSSR